MSTTVLDASVIVALFIPEPASQSAMALVERAGDPGMTFLVPDAIYFEVAATLRRHEARGAVIDLQSDLVLLRDLNFRATSCRDLMHDAVRISLAHRISPYDSFYLALAQRHEVPLVTIDARLIGATRGKGFNVIPPWDVPG